MAAKKITTKSRPRARRPSADVRFRRLKARVKRYGCELFRDCFDKMYIFDPGMGILCAVGLDEKTIEVEIEALRKDWRENAAPPAVRRAVNRVVKAYHDGGQDCTIEFDNALEELRKVVRAGGAA
jgi:hypothetical protein